MNHSTLPLPGLSPVAGKAVLARFDGGLLSAPTPAFLPCAKWTAGRIEPRQNGLACNR